MQDFLKVMFYVWIVGVIIIVILGLTKPSPQLLPPIQTKDTTVEQIIIAKFEHDSLFRCAVMNEYYKNKFNKIKK